MGKFTCYNLLVHVLDMASRPPALTLLAGLIVAGSLLIGVVNFFHTTGPLNDHGELCCGDFLSFWTGGVFLAEGRGGDLYDLGEQHAYQSTMVGKSLDQYQPYNYPPIVALSVAPMTRLGYPAAFASFGLLSFLLVSIGLLLLWPCLDGFEPIGKTTAFLMAVAFAPVMGTMIGGQTTAITFAIFCAHYAAVRRGWPLVTGVILGLLAYKPQFTLVLLLWHLVRMDVLVLASAAACGVLQYGVGTVAAGLDWPLRFLVTAHALGTSSSWAAAEVGFLSLPSALGWSCGATGRVVGWLAAGVVLAALADAARRLGPQSRDFGSFYALLVVATILANPYVNYYDYGILALPGMLYVNDRIREGELGLGARMAIGVAWFDYPVWETAHRLGFQPLALQLTAVFGVLWLACRRTAIPPVSPLQSRIAVAGIAAQL